MCTSIIEMFEQTVKRYPEKIAVSDNCNRISFEQLKMKALAMAQIIVSKYNDGNHPVGVMIDRTVDSIVMILGVLYSGNYYVPIDPFMPAEKKRMIFEDAEIEVLLGKQEYALSESGLVSFFIPIDDLEAGEEGYQKEQRLSELDTPLYMVYTSGSTGKPKGVLKSHGAMINFIDAYVETFGFDSEEVIGNQSPFYFDAAAKDLYLMIKTGATLEIIPTELFSFPPSLVEYMNVREITFISWIPTALSMVVQFNTFTEILPITLKKIFFVGEVFPIKYLKKWRKYLPDVQYVNLYGASELAGICCYYEINQLSEDAEYLPIGQAMKNCRVYLMDEDEVIKDNDRAGEICVASDALALGYFHDDEKNRERFQIKVIDNQSVRIYRTGDLGKYDEKGCIIYIGREDFQVKHHGHRIELGEIEAVVNHLEKVARGCCLYDHKKSKIILFCQLNEGCDDNERDILNSLRGKLSEYMLPNKIIKLPSIPLNQNGKIDRQKLKMYL